MDRALGEKVFPDALRAHGIHVEKHRDHFSQDEDDEVWIRDVAQRGWFALSNDKRIHSNPVQRAVVMQAGLGYFILTGANARADALAANFVAVYPAVLRFIERTPRPFIASVRRPDRGGRPGRIALLASRR